MNKELHEKSCDKNLKEKDGGKKTIIEKRKKTKKTIIGKGNFKGRFDPNRSFLREECFHCRWF